MSNEEKTVENGSQENKAEAKSYSEEQFKGLLADKQAEVKKRQEAEQQIAALQKQLSQQTAPASRGNEGNDQNRSFDDAQDRPLTMGQFKQLMAEQNKVNAENAFLVRQAQSEKSAMAELTPAACGEGLDFASVVAAGQANLTEGDTLAIRAAENPAMEKYRRCILLTPELAQRQESVRTARLLENIKLTGRVPASGSGGDVKTTSADVESMSEEELNKLAESIG
jgi:hypothetical protein